MLRIVLITLLVVTLGGFAFWWESSQLDTKVLPLHLGDLKAYSKDTLYFRGGYCKRPINKEQCIKDYNFTEKNYAPGTQWVESSINRWEKRPITNWLQEKAFLDSPQTKVEILKAFPEIPNVLDKEGKSMHINFSSDAHLLDDKNVLISPDEGCHHGIPFKIYNKVTHKARRKRVKTLHRDMGESVVLDNYLIIWGGNYDYSIRNCHLNIFSEDSQPHPEPEIEYIDVKFITRS